MEALWFLLILVFFFAPVVLSIVALLFAVRTRRELDALKGALQGIRTPPGEPSSTAPAAAATPAPEPQPPGAQEPSASAGPPPIRPADREARPEPAPPARDSQKGLEIALGGQVASLIGIAALVMGVAFFVGYAIQHDLIGPGTRIGLGLVSGGILIGLGHLAEVRGKRLDVLARVLTGGGAALFYFCVFAAHGVYGLIGPAFSMAGLVVSAVVTLALAWLYHSQVVAVLGVVGAFITPALIGGEFNSGLFPLFFIATVNLPVMALGLRRHWQVLYNLAFVFTVGFAAGWIVQESAREGGGSWAVGLVFSLVYFVEFAVLGLLKLWDEKRQVGRSVDVARLLLASLALLAAVYRLLDASGHGGWMGAGFLLVALLHIGFARVGWTWLPAYRDEILGLLIGALTFASLALPAQLDGAWVSLGWSMEGVLLAWYALKVGSPALQLGALLLGGIGLFKPLIYDHILYDAAPPLFLNARFATGLLAAVLLGLQGWLHGRREGRARGADLHAGWGRIIALVAVVGWIGAVFAETVFVLGLRDPLTGFLPTAALLASGLALTAVSHRASLLYAVGVVMLVLVPVKLVLVDLVFGWDVYRRHYDLFWNLLFWMQLGALGVAAGWCAWTHGGHWHTGGIRWELPIVVNVSSLLAGVLLVTLEISRMEGAWVDSAITLWWAVCAFGLAALGFARRRRYLRYFALGLFGLSALKVFLVDLSALDGLQRVAAFIGLGILLLVLSFAYQRVAPVFLREEKHVEQEP